jgi:hypothetical protein
MPDDLSNTNPSNIIDAAAALTAASEAAPASIATAPRGSPRSLKPNFPGRWRNGP